MARSDCKLERRFKITATIVATFNEFASFSSDKRLTITIYFTVMHGRQERKLLLVIPIKDFITSYENKLPRYITVA